MRCTHTNVEDYVLLGDHQVTSDMEFVRKSKYLKVEKNCMNILNINLHGSYPNSVLRKIFISCCYFFGRYMDS